MKLFNLTNVNRLSLNIYKTNYVIFHPFNKPLEQQITTKIQKIAKSKDLYKISWSYNTQLLENSYKISRAIGIMYKLSPFKFYYVEKYLL